MEREYLVCYFHWTNNVSSGFGDIVIVEGENEDIFTAEELQAVRKYIEERYNYSGCSIQNIIPLH